MAQSETPTPRRLTAAQIILLAGDDLTNAGVSEFSEWELTVASWRRDRDRFGLRGYQEHYPDHKRVMMEIMGQKPHNPIHLKLMEKLRPNYYRLTSFGRDEANRLRNAAPGDLRPAARPRVQTVKAPTRTTAPEAVAIPVAATMDRVSARKQASGDQLYDLVYDFVYHPTFGAWKDDPEEPRSWTQALQFFGKNARSEEGADIAAELEKNVRAALDHCMANDLNFLAPGSKGSRRIPMSDLGRLNDFIKAMRGRFESYLGSGRKKAVTS
jgi:hypothetical protein